MLLGIVQSGKGIITNEKIKLFIRRMKCIHFNHVDSFEDKIKFLFLLLIIILVTLIVYEMVLNLKNNYMQPFVFFRGTNIVRGQQRCRQTIY